MSRESPAQPGSRINSKRVIVLMTVAIFVVLTGLMTVVFGGLPPWPILVCFGISHLIFCVMVSRAKPFNGPYTKPLTDPDPSDWPR